RNRFRIWACRSADRLFLPARSVDRSSPALWPPVAGGCVARWHWAPGGPAPVGWRQAEPERQTTRVKLVPDSDARHSAVLRRGRTTPSPTAGRASATAGSVDGRLAACSAEWRCSSVGLTDICR